MKQIHQSSIKLIASKIHARGSGTARHLRSMIALGLFLFMACDGLECDSDSRSWTPVTAESSTRTGDEILFNADDFPELQRAASDPMHAKYIWSFGDARGPEVEGRSATYTFTSAGEYTVTLDVTPAIHVSDAGTPDDEDDDSWAFNDGDTVRFTRVVTVTGPGPQLIPQVSDAPIFSLGFDDSIEDSSADTHTVTWKDGSEGSFVDGLSGKAVDLSGGKALVIDTDNLLAGRSEFTISFWAKKKDLSVPTSCTLWQGRENPYQPVVRFLIMDAVSGSRMLDCVSVQIYTDTVNSTSAFNLSRETNWHHYAYTYSDGESHLYRDGILLSEGTPTGSLAAPTTKLYIGYGEEVADGETVPLGFNGYIDDLRIYGSALSEHDLTTGFGVRHADFHGHIAQYIYVDVPEQITSDAGSTMYAAVTGGGLSSPLVLADNTTGLESEERLLLQNSSIPGSDAEYTLTVSLLDSEDNTVFEKAEHFYKTYDGSPEVGIDENSAICLNGEPFFPVTPWGIGGAGQTDYTDVNEWVDGGYINALYGQGFWPPPWDIDGYRAYLDHAATRDMKVIGPATRWDGRGNLLNYGEGNYPFTRCTDLLKLDEYVDALSDHAAQMMWQWMDEPELYGLGAHQLRSWTLASHQRDPQHLVATNFMGHPYSYVNDSESYWGQTRRTYALGYNALQFGAARSVADVVGMDNYPLDGVSDDTPDTMNRLGTMLDTIRDENLALMPVISCVETADASNTNPGTGHPTPWKPSPAQLKMITWFNVVHEVKGILWFHYFNGEDDFATPDSNLAFMNTFTAQMDDLAPVVLGPRADRTVGVACSGTGRVDTMLRYYGGTWYLIAVRVSEFAVQPNTLRTPPPAADPSTVTVTFSLGADISGAASDYEGVRPSITVSGGVFTDTFEPFAVRIYEIE